MENNQKASRPRAPRAPKAATPGVSDTRQNTAAPAAKPAASQTGAVPAAAPKPARRPYHPRRRRPAAASAGTPAVPVKIMPLGGLGEVGKNITLYECQGDMILVDCGIVFPDSDMFGVDLVIPDFTYVVQNKDRIKGVVITHGHEDHIGGLPYLLKEVNLPIYATRLTIGLITNKLEEHGLVRSTKMVEIAPHQKFKLGCFTVEPIHVNHSIPDAVALAITCPAGTIIQTGDFKIDYTPISGGPTDLVTIAEYGEHGVLALLSDSTNAERPGFTATEQKVGASMEALFSRAGKKRIIIATFASNLYRVQQLIDLAVKAGRKVAVSGRSMVNNTQMALELGYLHAPETVLIDIEDINKYPPEKIVLITTGSQGEPLSALSRMAAASHRNVRVGEGDFIIISANPIPGNEKMVTKVVNGLLKLGAEVIYESMYEVHVSGHASQEELKLMLALTKPSYFMPVHGEAVHLRAHAALGQKMGVPAKNIFVIDNGDSLEMRDGIVKRGRSVESGVVYVDGLRIGDTDPIVLRDRQKLASDGMVTVVAMLDMKRKKIGDLEFSGRGVSFPIDDQFSADASAAIQRAIEKGKFNFSSSGTDAIRKAVRDALSNYIWNNNRTRPMIIPVVMEV